MQSLKLKLTKRWMDAQTDLPLIKIVLGTDNYLRETGVKVQCICPAFAQTAIIQNIDQYSAFSGDIYIFYWLSEAGVSVTSPIFIYP